MLLYLDLRNTVSTAGAIALTPRERGGWVSANDDRMGVKVITKARAKFGFDRKPPEAVVVAMNAPGATARDVSWSGVRAGIAAANALAFAWGVPVAAVALNGDEAQDTLAVLAREAAAGAEPGVWVTARYSGEPNITKPKESR